MNYKHPAQGIVASQSKEDQSDNKEAEADAQGETVAMTELRAAEMDD